MIQSTDDNVSQANLKADLYLNKAKMCYQKKEIEWTLSMITKFQATIYQHKETLNDYNVEREVLKEEKSYLISLQDDEYDADYDSDDDDDDSVEPLNTDDRNDLPKLVLFSEIYEILKTPKPQQHYKAIIDHLTDLHPSTELLYSNETLIPNDLKVSTVKRKMILYRIDTIGEYPLADIIKEPVNMSLDLHIASGSGELLSLRGEEPHTQYHTTAVSANMSFYILRCQTTATTFVLLATGVPLTLAVEVNSRIDEVGEVGATKLPCPSGYTREPPPPPVTGERQLSFLRRQLTLNEIRNRLLFVDASFAESVHGRLVVISLTVVNYSGNVVVNTIVCPRVRVRNYCQDQHGFIEKDVIGKPDSEATLADLHTLIWDKILVGHDLGAKLENLNIDVRNVCGVRDLQGCVTLTKLMTSGGSCWPLGDISRCILQQPIRKVACSSEYNVHIIRMVYLAIESQWQDSVPDHTVDTETASLDTSVAPATFFYGAKRRIV